MNKNKIMDYTNFIAIHTIEFKAENTIELSKKIESLYDEYSNVIQSTTPHKNSKYIKIKANINKMTSQKYLYNQFDLFQEKFNELVGLLECREIVNRVDICFDFYKTGDYIKFYKLHLYLMCLLSTMLDIEERNRYNTYDLFKNKSKEIKIINDYHEFVYYDKQVQTNYDKTEPKARFEIRLKRLSHNTVVHDFNVCYRKLSSLLDKLVDGDLMTKTIMYTNDNLMKIYSEQKENKELYNKKMSFNSDKEFITQNSDLIFSSKQLQDLYKRLGYDKCDIKAIEYKRKSRELEYFTKEDLKIVVRTLKEMLQTYFTHKNSYGIFWGEAN